MKYKRILLKLSGEALGTQANVLDKGILNGIYQQIKILNEEFNVQIAIVVGGGNMFRGALSESLGLGEDTAPADYMGMLATSINALGLTTFLKNKGLDAVMQNSLELESISEKVNPKKAIDALEKGRIVIFGGGTGKPYVSTDTGAAMRAIDIDAEVILMAKNGVDGVYTHDPLRYPDAQFIDELTFDEVVNKNLKVVDFDAMKMLKGKNIDILLFNMNTPNNIINLYKDNSTRKTIIKDK